MVLRPVEAEFAPHAQVFPGGRVDDSDADPSWQELVAFDKGRTEALLEEATEPGHPTQLAYVVGALREVFEETRVLLGLSPERFPGEDWAGTARSRVHASEVPFATILKDAGLRLEPAPITYFARWVTPEGLPKRYDTRFFAAPMPAGQEAVAAEGEIQSLEWITPAAALARADTEDAYTLPPTRAVLTTLAQYDDVASALAGLLASRDLSAILPRILSGTEASPDIRVVLPGESGYDAKPGA